ncbi:site-specific DNA-methyltransferase [Geobacillus stearothermophilus]|nr:site-specific DNA-methyltransferase [Geobacillus stearothermophilus]KOR94804.1 restriction endonuclease subunit M [Geobacillus stearothermophilus ATCC 12980]MED4880728.1 site-specific DNA-methyltransferase [Geobacillus stearothermophilus]MED5010653.1 site-specific DNA-methyltransferase [Geobacillus stearothermophilus]MED5014734.1 site-specific DNA-methyltransferase [Geobacillus stearothermophilus]MED5043513.1 site-specific DNA-methyltransferase [Geobacillus stearothermophilus]
MATGIPSPKTNANDEFTFELTYQGKIPEDKIIFGTQKAKLKEVLSIHGDYYNQIIFGDNLYILRTLLDNKDIVGKVRLIYIDPPYGTNSSFKSRSQEHAYDDNLIGDKYLEFIRQRLILMRELLADDGSIYVHLDSHMAFPVKIIMDEVFGQQNFRNWITRQKCNPKNYTRKQYGNISDYILFYSKTKNYVFNQPFQPWDEETAKKEYPYVEEETGRRFKKVPLHAPGIRNGETGKAWRGILPPPGKHWQYTPSKLDEMDKNGEIYWSPNGNPRRKVYLDNSKGIPVQDIWLNFKDAHNQNAKITGYPTEKNPNMLKQIILASSNEGDIVLDAFAGSGTTIAVAEEHRRKWIAIDNSSLAIKTMLNRLINGTKKMGDFVKKEFETEQLELLNQRILTNGLKVYVDENHDVENMEALIHEWADIINFQANRL